MATLTGIAFFCHQTGSFVGAWGAGLLFDAMGNYDLAWQIGVAIGVIAGDGPKMFMNDTPTIPHDQSGPPPNTRPVISNLERKWRPLGDSFPFILNTRKFIGFLAVSA